jgi:hypothetical protein
LGGLSGAGFSLRGLDLARAKFRRLQPAPLKSQFQSVFLLSVSVVIHISGSPGIAGKRLPGLLADADCIFRDGGLLSGIRL